LQTKPSNNSDVRLTLRTAVLAEHQSFHNRIIYYFYYITTISREKRRLCKWLNIRFKKWHLVVFTTMLASVSVAIQRMRNGSFRLLGRSIVTMPGYSIPI